MQPVAELKSDLLQELFWRDEIPEAIYWLEGEGHGPGVDSEALERVLPAEPAFSPEYLDSLVEAGLQPASVSSYRPPGRRRRSPASESGRGTGDAVGLGAGMGGFLTYDADGPISTTMDEVGGNPGGTGEPGNLNSGSTGGRGAGQQ